MIATLARMGRKRNKTATAHGFAETAQPYATGKAYQTAEIGAGGRIVIPAAMRAALGMKVGDRITIQLDANEVRLYAYQEGLRRVRASFRKLVPEGASLVDELIADRRREAAEELKDSEDD